MSNGLSNKRKGTRVEREMVKKLESEGIPAWRVPMSGALGGSLNSDIKVGPDKEFDVEVKARKGGGGFAVIEKWLGSNHLLFLKRNHAEPMVVMEWTMFLGLMKAKLKEDEVDKALDWLADEGMGTGAAALENRMRGN
jgi:Holliday junction resolvase|tara:strand:+ start:481 stop:894 length:414 start_codon:yes stop_codon:yes gene_type:complete